MGRNDTPSPFLTPCNLSIRVWNCSAIAGNYFSSTAHGNHTPGPQLKKLLNPNSHFTLCYWLPAAIFNENLTAHICISSNGFCWVSAVIKYWCAAPLRAEPVWADTLGQMCGRKGTDNKQTDKTHRRPSIWHLLWKDVQLKITYMITQSKSSNFAFQKWFWSYKLRSKDINDADVHLVSY